MARRKPSRPTAQPPTPAAESSPPDQPTPAPEPATPEVPATPGAPGPAKDPTPAAGSSSPDDLPTSPEPATPEVPATPGEPGPGKDPAPVEPPSPLPQPGKPEPVEPPSPLPEPGQPGEPEPIEPPSPLPEPTPVEPPSPVPEPPSPLPEPTPVEPPAPDLPPSPGDPKPVEPTPLQPPTPGEPPVDPTPISPPGPEVPAVPGDPEPVGTPPDEPPPAPTADTVTPKPSRGRKRAAPQAQPETAAEAVTREMPIPPVGSMEPPEDEPAAAEGETEADAAGAAAARRGPSRQRGLRAALASLPVPEPGPSFWADIDRAMAEQPPLAISARPAIRSINEPPPLSQPSLSDLGTTAVLITDDSVLTDEELGLGPLPTGGGGDGDDRDRPRGGGDDDSYHGPPAPLGGLDSNRANTRTVVVVAVAVIAVVLIAGSALGRRGGDDPSGATPSVTTAAGASTTATTAKPPTTPPGVPGLDAAARLAPSGLGPLRIGTNLRDLTAAGVRSAVDQPTFETSGGACYDVRLPGAPDLTLRFRSPEADEGVADAQDGELAFVGVAVAPGSTRITDTGLHLGSTEDEVRAALQDVEVTDHPTNPGGHVFVSEIDDGTGTGVAYGTDGRTVIEIAVGYIDAITQRQGCR